MPNEPSRERLRDAQAEASKVYVKSSQRLRARRCAIAIATLLLIPAVAVAGCAVEEEPTSEQTPAATSESATKTKAAAKEKAAAKKKAAAKEEPEMTSGQKNALQAGQNYVDTMPFSKAGLIQQLSSSAGDGYSKADATFAAKNVDANWNKEAVEAAKNYLEIMPMSQDALVDQLSSSAGDKFTAAQARYAAEKVY